MKCISIANGNFCIHAYRSNLFQYCYACIDGIEVSIAAFQIMLWVVYIPTINSYLAITQKKGEQSNLFLIEPVSYNAHTVVFGS